MIDDLSSPWSFNDRPKGREWTRRSQSVLRRGLFYLVNAWPGLAPWASLTSQGHGKTRPAKRLQDKRDAFPLERKRQSGSIGPFSPFPWAVRNAREERKAAPIDNARLLSFSYAFLYTRIKEKKRKRKGL